MLIPKAVCQYWYLVAVYHWVLPRQYLGWWAVGWPAHEAEALNAARIAGKSNDEVRALVVALETARKQAA